MLVDEDITVVEEDELGRKFGGAVLLDEGDAKEVELEELELGLPGEDDDELDEKLDELELGPP